MPAASACQADQNCCTSSWLRATKFHHITSFSPKGGPPSRINLGGESAASLITEAPTLDELLVRAQEALAMLLDANHEAREHRRLRLVATAA